MGQPRRGAGVLGVLLAGGDGTRLQALTARIEGDSRPKQFCRILEGESLFAQTRRRIGSLFDTDRIIAVVTKKHEGFYSRELNNWPRTAVIAQPENRGTGVAIATAILTLNNLDSDAIVATFPCDHHYINDAALLRVIEAGIEAVQEKPDAIVLIGAEATHPETEYGWIEPVEATRKAHGFAPSRVRHFWEKPTFATAQALLRRGCLWNTFVTIGCVRTLIEVLWRAAPDAMGTLSSGVLENDLDSSYALVPSIDFSC